MAAVLNTGGGKAELLGHPVEGVDVGHLDLCGLLAGEAHHQKHEAVLIHFDDARTPLDRASLHHFLVSAKMR
nr:hypothetical protein [Halomonas piscis]